VEEEAARIKGLPRTDATRNWGPVAGRSLRPVGGKEGGDAGRSLMALTAGAAGNNRLVASVGLGGQHEAADELHVLVVPSGLQPNDTEDAANDTGRPAEGLQLRPRDAVGGGSHCGFLLLCGTQKTERRCGCTGQPQLSISANIKSIFLTWVA